MSSTVVEKLEFGQALHQVEPFANREPFPGLNPVCDGTVDSPDHHAFLQVHQTEMRIHAREREFGDSIGEVPVRAASAAGRGAIRVCVCPTYRRATAPKPSREGRSRRMPDSRLPTDHVGPMSAGSCRLRPGASTQGRAMGDMLIADEDESQIANPAVWKKIFAANRPA